MSDASRVDEGYVPFRGGRTWYRSLAAGSEDDARLPLLCLHGGPGANWLHLKPYEALADERRVVFYDQIGSGNSGLEEPHEVSIWQPELFVEEVGVVREALGLERVHVLGHSWGGMLGMQYATEQPEGLVSLIVESSPPSVPDWMPEVARLRSELPPEVEATLREHEEAGTTDSPEYEEASMVFYQPPCLPHRPVARLARRVLREARGESRGLPRDERAERVPRDRDDPATGTSRRGSAGSRCRPWSSQAATTRSTPACTEAAHRAIPGSEYVVLEESSHMAQAEQPEETLALVRGFLSRVEGAAGA